MSSSTTNTAAAGKKKIDLYDHSGADIKSIFWNITSILIFIIPIITYWFNEQLLYVGCSAIVSFIIAYTLPPIGWKRPHPYSDNPNNRTINRKVNLQ